MDFSKLLSFKPVILTPSRSAEANSAFPFFKAGLNFNISTDKDVNLGDIPLS